MIGFHSRFQKISQAADRLRAAWARSEANAEFPALVSKPPGTNIVVLSPHPDDDVIGSGGTLIKHARSGSRITSIYLTDGGRGRGARAGNPELAKTREKEAARAARLVGINELVFLRNADGALKCSEPMIGRLQALLETIRPDLVYLPFFLDPHPDHAATHEIFIAAAARLTFRFACCAYETWRPLIPNILVDITGQMPGKVAAIKQHRSQLCHYDYVRAARGLNAYRAVQNPGLARGKRFAEAFLFADRERYVSWNRKKG